MWAFLGPVSLVFYDKKKARGKSGNQSSYSNLKGRVPRRDSPAAVYNFLDIYQKIHRDGGKCG